MVPLIARSFISCLLYNLSIFRGICAYKRQQRAFLLNYHRIVQSPDSEGFFVQPGMYVSPFTFRLHLSFLKRHFQVLPLQDLVARIETKSSISGCCAITFDDGWVDNYFLAYPMLQQFEMPATIFLATGFIGTDRLFWPDEVAYHLKHMEFSQLANFSAILKILPSHILRSSLSDKQLDQVITTLKAYSPEERREFLIRLRSRCGISFNRRMMMNWNEIKEMVSSGLVRVGSHSHEHVFLDQVSLEEANKEVALSRREIEQRLGVSPTMFAYPNGNLAGGIGPVLKRNGFKAAVTTRKAWFNGRVNKYKIPRIGMHEDVSRTVPMFFARILLDRL